MSDFKCNGAIQRLNTETYPKKEKKPFSISHATFVSYLVGGVVKEAIEKDISLDYNSIFAQIDNITCNYTDENGRIETNKLDKECLKKELTNIALLSNRIDIENVIFNAFSIIWMESNPF